MVSICNTTAKAQANNFKYDRAGSFKEGMAPVYIGNLLGFIDKTGKEIVPVMYEEDYIPDEFKDGVAIVTKNGLSGLVDKTGKLVVPCEYKKIGEFSEGIAEAYKENGKVGFIDKQGKPITAFEYNILSLFGGVKCVNGMIPVQNNKNKQGYIDKTGKLVVPFQYETVYNFSDGLAMVRTRYNGRVSYINTKGEIVIPEKYENGTLFKDGLAYVNKGAYAKSLYIGLEGGKWGVIDKSGKEIIPTIYDHIYEIKNGLTIVGMGKYPNEKKGLVGRDGKIILPVEYNDIRILKGRLAVNKVRIGPYALFDYTGKQLCDFKWYLFDIFPEITEGLLRVQELKNDILGKAGAIDENGVLKIPMQFDVMTEFNEGLSTVSINKKYGTINKTGKTVIPLQYDGMSSFSEGWAIVYQNKKYGFINKSGKLMEFSKASVSVNVQKPSETGTYQYKEKFFDFFIIINGAVSSGTEVESTGGKFGILSKEEKVIIPPKYDWISIDTAIKVFFVQTGVQVYFSRKSIRRDTTANLLIGLVDYNGRQVYPPTLSNYIIRPNKHIMVKDAVTGKWGVLNISFKPVVPLNYDLIYDFSDSGIAAKKNGKFGIINLKNEILVPFEYDSVYNGGNKAPGGYHLKKAGNNIWVDAKGKIIQTAPDAAKTNAASQTLLFEENFDNNNKQWALWDNDGSSAQMYNGNYRFTVKNSNNYASWYSIPGLASDQSKDFAIETKMFLNSTETGNPNDSYWLLWGLGNDGKSFYAFGIYPEGKFQYGKNVNGSWDGKAGKIYAAAINAGINRSNSLRVEKRKDSIFFFINGIEVYKAAYETFNSNHAGIGFQLNNKKQLDIDYLKIYQGASR